MIAARGKRYVGDHVGLFCPGDLVLLGPNLPDRWISNAPEGEGCRLVLQFTGGFIDACMATVPELRLTRPLFVEALRGVRFENAMGEHIAPLMRDLLLAAKGMPPSTFHNQRGPGRSLTSAA